LAIGCATLDKFTHETDDLSVSCLPDALVLYNPVLYSGPNDGYGYDRVKEYWKDISPVENLNKGVPSTIVFAGTIDRVIPVPLANEFKEKLEKMGIRCESCLYEGQNHGFFNYGKGDNPYYEKTVAAMDEFLRSLGYIQ
jgi:acetyl esterase